ncbi:hypothetical protein K501DRAFT_267209 [Backusella circina FSU 941]|nr:hypothetical protein K501DRAFT_267209 [Backusella circina FSU 941]
MNSLGIDTSLAILENRQQQINSPMPFRRNSFIAANNEGTPPMTNEYYEAEDDDSRRWDKNPRNLLNFMGGTNTGGGGERPLSGVFSSPLLDEYINDPTTLLASQSTSTSTKTSRLMRPSSSGIRRRLSLTDGNPNGASISTSTMKHIRVRTKSLMRNTVTMTTTESDAPNLQPSNSTSTVMMNSCTPDQDHHHHQKTGYDHTQWDESFIVLLKQILRHLLEEEREVVGEPELWEGMMINLLLKVADQVHPHLHIRDPFNMNFYVKIKKIPGGKPQDSFFVNGVVMTKSVVHKNMVRRIENPRILILNFELDGESVRYEYLKFERLLEWEKTHMYDLVEKISMLRPSIVLIASTVPRTVIELLNKHGIVVASNIKKQKLDSIARCTDATVFNYKHELWNTKSLSQSKCGVFEALTVLHKWLPNQRKTFLMFQKCPKERGATIVLRGGTIETLQAIKYIMNFMVHVVNNINLEAQLRKEFLDLRLHTQPTFDKDTPNDEMGDIAGKSSVAEGSIMDAPPVDAQSISALSVAESQMTVNTIDISKKKNQQQLEPIIVEDDDICLTAINRVINNYQNTVLSVSPGVSIPIPHVLLKLRDSHKSLIGLIRERLGTASTGQTLTDSTFVSPIDVNNEKRGLGIGGGIPMIPTDLMHMPAYFKSFDVHLENDLEYKQYQDEHLQCWYIFKRYINTTHQTLSPVNYQHIIVHRTINPLDDHTIPCEKVVLEPYNYYNPAFDCTLGQYILNAINEAYTVCNSKMCGAYLISHEKTYSHGNAQIKVRVEDDPEGYYDEEELDLGKDDLLHNIPILMSTCCETCKIDHDWRQMPSLLQRYSFGKFLELLFYQSEGFMLDQNDENAQGKCPHGLYRDHTIQFRVKNFVLNFKHETVKVVEVHPPPLHLRFSTKKQMEMKEVALESTRSKIAKFFDSIIERNKGFGYDIVQPSMVELCKEYLQEMSQDALKNKKNLLQKLQLEYATSAPTDTLQLNKVLAELQRMVVNWDLRYIDFARKFVRPERELKRLTTNHLRKMFPAESLYNNPQPIVSNLNVRRKRAIEAADLPLLDVGLDESSVASSSGLSAQQIESTEVDIDLSLKEQPCLGESPTATSPWFEELTRFDEMFLQEKSSNNNNSGSASVSVHTVVNANNNSSTSSVARKKKSTDNESIAKSFDDIIDDCDSLDPSVARRLSLELMKDAPKKKKEESSSTSTAATSNTTANTTANTTTSITMNTGPNEDVQRKRRSYGGTATTTITTTTAYQNNNNSSTDLMKHPASPILSSSTYKRLAGFLPDPIVGKSKSTPSPVGIQQRHHVSPYQKLMESSKTTQRKVTTPSHSHSHSQSQFFETSSNSPKPNSYRGSPFTPKIQEFAKTYRYGFQKESSNNNSESSRPRSRTVATSNNGPSNYNYRAGRGRIPIPTHNLHTTPHEKVKFSGGSQLPVPISQRRRLPDGSLRIRQRLPSKASLEAYTVIKELSHEDESSEDEFLVSDESDDEDSDDRLPFQHTTFSLTHTDEYDESLGRELVPSIQELQQFNKEHQLQMFNNTLPFLSIECGMAERKKSAECEPSEMNRQFNRSMVEEVMRANGIDTRSATTIDWSTSGNSRNSIMKAITYVLAEKSISNLLPLDYPVSPIEHVFEDSNILVREDEISSIISYMLGSTTYNEKLKQMQAIRMAMARDDTSLYSENEKNEKSGILGSSADTLIENDGSFYSEIFPETEERERPWRFTFTGGSTTFSCKIYFAEQFDMLRKSCGCGETFISSLARCSTYDPAGGKSGSLFLRTKDERFLIKQISRFEMDAFLGSAKRYFAYMFNEVFDKEIPTVLSKIFGLYRVGYYNNMTGKSVKLDILVMENLFYETSVKNVFDLKGSMRNRWADKSGKEIEVLLDENLVELISKNPLHMHVDTKINLSDSLYNDTQFLLQLDVMDYSLLVGFDEEQNEMVVGIVDFIRTFTWDKKLESWVKESGMLGGGKKDPTIVSPRMYRRRFRSAIDLYFRMIPDFWTIQPQQEEQTI